MHDDDHEDGLEQAGERYLISDRDLDRLGEALLAFEDDLVRDRRARLAWTQPGLRIARTAER